jgi:sulfur-oxidizing protein SoxX
MLFNKTCFHIVTIFALLLSSFYNASASPKTGNIINYVIENNSIIASLGGLTGDPDAGRALVRNQNKGNFLSCHQLPIPEDDFHGNIGPSLYTVGMRFNTAQLRIRVADMKLINPFTIMPGFYKANDTINRIAAQYEGSTILSAQEVEDIVSYLITLKTQANTNLYESYP